MMVARNALSACFCKDFEDCGTHSKAPQGQFPRVWQGRITIMPRLLPRRAIVQGLAAAASMLSTNSFGAEPMIVRSRGAVLTVHLLGDDFDLPQRAILDWVQRCANAVSTWLGEFPVRSATIRIVQSDRDGGVLHGRSWGGKQAECQVSVGRHATAGDLYRDWVLTHELFHFAFPYVPERHHWIEEGISTYAEPLARSGIGLLAPEQVWNDMTRECPKACRNLAIKASIRRTPGVERSVPSRSVPVFSRP